MPQVFINYRVQDQAGYAALLDHELSGRFGPETIFRSSRSIPAGRDFAEEITRILRECSVMLVVMGPDWADHLSTRPADDERDWVRYEIAHALTRKIPVIPILVEGATMPAEAKLPNDIAGLAPMPLT